MLALDSTRLLHINEIEWSGKKSKNIWEIVCGAKDEITKPTIMFFLYWCFEWHKKKPEMQSRFCRRNRKSKRKKVSRRLLERSQLFVFMVKAPQTSNQFQKVSRIIPNIRYEKHLSGTATVWMVFNWKRIYRYQKFKQKTQNKKRTDSIPF